MSSYRIRFRFNQQTGGNAIAAKGGTKGFENFARAIVNDVAVSHADAEFEFIKNMVQQRMAADIERELEHMIDMVFGHVIGIAGRNRGPTGELTTIAPPSDAMKGVQLSYSARSLSGEWPRRSPFYMQSRRRYGDAWFQRTGAVLSALRNPKAWTAAYGGIVVSIKKYASMERKDAGNLSFTMPYAGKDSPQVSVCTIRVEVMNRITPGMLPALGGASLGDYGQNPRGSGLLRALGDRIAWRLGGNPHTVPWRPTIQPFLAYFLMRQMPNAVFKRIEQGFGQQRWKWQVVRHTN